MLRPVIIEDPEESGPCTACVAAERCTAQLLACTRFERFASGQPISRWHLSPRTDATRERYVRIFGEIALTESRVG